MKKIILLILIIATKLQVAQTWCPPGANWHYKDFYPWWTAYRMGVTELKFTNTVTINSTVCCEIAKSFTGVIGDPNNPVTTMTYAPLYTYENNRVYYLYNSTTSSFDTICNFNANIGDKWGICFVMGCSSKPTLTVVDTGHVLINSQFLKKIVVSPSTMIYDTIIEKIGGFNHYLGAYYKCIADLPQMPDFICYQDNNFPLYMKSKVYTCLYDVGLNELENELSFSLYPNPSTDQFTIKSSTDNIVFNKLTITNALGQKLQEYTDFPTNKEIPIKTFSKGIYFIRLEHQNQSRTYKLIKN